jgi:RNA polymerase sporulation-specific sigma factor
MSKSQKSQKSYIEEELIGSVEQIDLLEKVGVNVSDAISENESDCGEECVEVNSRVKKEVEDILFKLPLVSDPIVGSPKDAQLQIDELALKMQVNLDSKFSMVQFDRIHLYMHGYFLNVVLKQFPYIKGYETVDIYQEALIAVRFKALPNFDPSKGMSFLNFAKMCVRRHLITILHASKTRLKDQAINQSISLDACMREDDDDSGEDFYSQMSDDSVLSASEITSSKEAYAVTLKNLKLSLSNFEICVLEEWLTCGSYKEIAKKITEITKKPCYPKSVDNALLRIRKKAEFLKLSMKDDELPLFIK